MTRADLLQKRQQIEQGQLRVWSRHGRVYQHQHHKFRDPLLLRVLRLLGLQVHGERNARHPVVKRLSFTFDTLPDAFDGFTILHLTDLHADGQAGLADSVYEKVRDLEVDLCVLTGDYRFDTKGSCQQVYPNMERILSGVHARHGIVGVLGNHDWFEMVAELERMGVQMLLNKSLAIRHDTQSIWLVGVDDPHYYGCADVSVALDNVPEEAFKILLVHTPELYTDAAWHDVQLYLCGHTHGGQICLPLFGPVVTNANCPRKYARGRWRYHNVQGYTNTGAGTSGVTVRFFCPGEIGLITLQRTTTSATPLAPGDMQRNYLPLP